MDSMVTTFKSIHTNMRQANLAQLDDVVKRFRSQDQEQSRNLEIIVSRLDADFAQLSADQVLSKSASFNLNPSKEYVLKQLEEVRHDEINKQLVNLRDEVDQANHDNEQLRKSISDLDLSLDPLLTLGDPDEVIKRICKNLLIEQGLIDSQ